MPDRQQAVRRPPRRPVASPAGTGYLLLLAGMALVGTYVALSRPLVAVVPVFLLAWLRFAIAAVAMLPWLRRRPGDAPIDAGLQRTLFAQSFFGNFLFSIFMLTGVARTSATAAGLVLSLMPAAVALLSWLVLRERIGARTGAAILLSGIGLALLAGAGASPGGGAPDLLGHLLLVAAVGCESAYVVLGKRLTGQLSARRISALINLVGLVLMTPFGLWQAASFDFSRLGAGDWALLVFYSLSASMFATWLWLSGLARVPAARSGVFTIAMPLAASAVGIVWLGERPGLVHLVAFACAAAAIVLVTRPSHPVDARVAAGGAGGRLD
ncbi:MAG: DMT family transporter [Burkholderiaceae bacterium]